MPRRALGRGHHHHHHLRADLGASIPVPYLRISLRFPKRQSSPARSGGGATGRQQAGNLGVPRGTSTTTLWREAQPAQRVLVNWKAEKGLRCHTVPRRATQCGCGGGGRGGGNYSRRKGGSSVPAIHPSVGPQGPRPAGPRALVSSQLPSVAEHGALGAGGACAVLRCVPRSSVRVVVLAVRDADCSAGRASSGSSASSAVAWVTPVMDEVRATRGSGCRVAARPRKAKPRLGPNSAAGRNRNGRVDTLYAAGRA